MSSLPEASITNNLILNVLSDDPSVEEIAESWINGNRSWVIDQLWKYPPHMTAQVVLILADKLGEANSLTNLLIDRFLDKRDAMKSEGSVTS